MRFRRKRFPEFARGVGPDGFIYWPACPTCGGPLGCVGREPGNAVLARIYRMSCNEFGHRSKFTRAEIMGMQAKRALEVDA